jgi:hypothetical protein
MTGRFTSVLQMTHDLAPWGPHIYRLRSPTGGNALECALFGNFYGVFCLPSEDAIRMC